MHKSLLLLISAVAAILLIFKPSSIFATHWSSVVKPLSSSLPQLNLSHKANNFLFPQSPYLSPLGSLLTSVGLPPIQAEPTIAPTPTFVSAPQTSSSSDSKKIYILRAVNDYRSSLGLSIVSPSPVTCNFAKIRSQEISTDFSHRGFQSRVDSKTLPYVNYHVVTENIARASNYRQVVTLWINSPGHAENMRKDTPYVCVASTGDYYAYEGLKP